MEKQSPCQAFIMKGKLMFLRIKNVKAIEKQRNAYVLIIDNKYEKNGESLFWINEDAFDIIRNMNGINTFDNLISIMTKGKSELYEEAVSKLQEFITKLRSEYSIQIDESITADRKDVPILGSGKTQYPSAISVEITHRCNARCLHCYGDYSEEKLFYNNTNGIIKILNDAREAGTRVVEFTGGEVTCHPKFNTILQEAYKLDYSIVSILSNGLFWKNDLFDIVKNNADKTVIQIDLHGDTDDYVNWFMGTRIPHITNHIKRTIKIIHNMGIFIRVVTMVTPKNICQIEKIADWVYKEGIETYGISVITPMGRANLNDENDLLLKTEEHANKIADVISRINNRYGKGFLYEVRDGNTKLNNCGAFTSNPSITPSGDIKFCAMDDGTLLKPIGNVFEKNIGELFTEEYKLLDLVRSIKAPMYSSIECRDCEKKYFCSYCIIRGLFSAKEKGYENCKWYKNNIPIEFRRYIV